MSAKNVGKLFFLNIAWNSAAPGLCPPHCYTTALRSEENEMANSKMETWAQLPMHAPTSNQHQIR